jgi:hypothetical protein
MIQRALLRMDEPKLFYNFPPTTPTIKVAMDLIVVLAMASIATE